MVLTSTHNLCFEQKYEKYQSFLSENFQFLVVKFSIYLNRHVFVMCSMFLISRYAIIVHLSINVLISIKADFFREKRIKTTFHVNRHKMPSYFL